MNQLPLFAAEQLRPRLRLNYSPREQAFRWLWLMYVDGVDVGQHCQACLLGTRSAKVGTRWLRQGRDRLAGARASRRPAITISEARGSME